MKKSEYQKIIKKNLQPKLKQLGFKEIKLKDCMRPEVLYNKERIWFGSSWDYRDQYLDLSLGHLYWFKDVMPRVIVLGNYKSYTNKIEKIINQGSFSLEDVALGVFPFKLSSF